MLNSDKKYIHSVIRKWRELAPQASSYKKSPFGKYELTEEGIDHTSKVLYIYDFMLDENGELPIKFYRCNSIEIVITNPNALRSFKNFPRIISRRFQLSPLDNAFSSAYAINISSLEGIPRIISGGNTALSLLNFPKLSLHNVHLHIDRADTIYLGNYKGPLLSTLLMKYKHNPPKTLRAPNTNKQLCIAVDIINKHMASGDILECQEELIANGLKEYAKL